ncbi:MAG: peptidase U32 [Treponema sp.]|nr:MAG: peptidase U32 [Treponema sp.]
MVELLAPAGSVEAMNAAVSEGADAVYLGLKSFNARMRSSNFSWAQFQATVEALHKRNKKVYVTVNTVITDDETAELFSLLKFLNSVGPDGVIVQDFGVVKMIREYFPDLNIHASTQMNIASAKSANAMSRFGVSRVVLARELSLNEIREIKQYTSCELEMFVHGALCISESGLCMFSSFLGGKSANRGMCTQACRRIYNIDKGDKKQSGFYFSPYDLQLLDYIPELIDAGVNSFKIEGRMKSAEYVGTVVSAYRYVIDNYHSDAKAAIEHGKRILANDFARSKTSFMLVTKKLDSVLNPKQAAGTGLYLGKVSETKKFDIQEVSAKGEDNLKRKVHYAFFTGGSGFIPVIGDSLRLHSKNDTVRESWKIQDVKTANGKSWIQIPVQFGIDDNVYLLQTKAMTKRYSNILPKSLTKYKKRPQRAGMPDIELDLNSALQNDDKRNENGKKHRSKKRGNNPFPDGYYVQVSSIRDVHALLIDKPVRVIINLNEDTENALLSNNTAAMIPFARSEVLISLDPFLPQEIESALSKKLNCLIENGYKQFVLNNPGHISMLRNKSLNLIAGPYLYSFNKWSASWLTENGLNKFVSPIENSQDNIEQTFKLKDRSEVLCPVFAYPVLFRIRQKLPEKYDFLYFSDKTGEEFRAFSTPSAAFVLPEKPFSITERTGLLAKKGLKKYLIDFSHTSVERHNYRLILNACKNAMPLPDTSKFNWKEGFYNPQKIEALKKHSKKQQDERQKQRRAVNTKHTRK